MQYKYMYMYAYLYISLRASEGMDRVTRIYEAMLSR